MLIPFGKKDGVLVHVNNVENGASCGCICPNCGRPLVAKNRGKKKRQHFAHAVGFECSDYDTMTYLHQYAQDLILAKGSVMLPSYEQRPELSLLDGGRIYGDTVARKAQRHQFDSVKLEVSWSQYRIDCVGTTETRDLFIEITVTHENESEKLGAFKREDVPAIEVDLSQLHNSDRLYDDEAINAAVFNPENGQWLNHPRAENEYVSRLDELKAEQARRNEAIRKQQVEAERQREFKRKVAEAEQRRIDAARQKRRDELSEELEWLDMFNSGEEIQRLKAMPIDEELASNLSVSAPWPITGMPVKGSWIFGVRNEDWQHVVLDFLNLRRKPEFSANDVKRHLVRTVGIHPVMKRLNIARYEAKKQTRKRGKDDSYGAWYLSKEENRKIISPFVPVSEYLKHLVSMSMIARHGENYLLTSNSMKNNVDQMLREREENAKRLALEEEKDRELLEEQQELERVGKGLYKGEIEERARQLATIDNEIFQEERQDACRCANCYFLARSIPADSKCEFCGQFTLTGELEGFDSYNPSLFHKYRCTQVPKKSLRALSRADLLSRYPELFE
ncbi:hypothetical protein [Umboniibacter marinipuniceus]|uniref:Competence protein CoiA-like protein n=1 Tax=Umboniibacter marinipuniceus TaxID=569599 RepID=A0A3M0AGM3_9GAMM|nr:hypothetical protein [Umboniibacter marinipuniceus]RMA82709.1 hypothetical protein DFR27_0666 [Umboniibacter marinipuniceus]